MTSGSQRDALHTSLDKWQKERSRTSKGPLATTNGFIFIHCKSFSLLKNLAGIQNHKKEISVFLERNYVSCMNASKASVSQILDYLRILTVSSTCAQVRKNIIFH